MSSTADVDGNWNITDVSGLALGGLELRFEIADGSIFGQAPCNSFQAELIAADGEFSLGALDLRGNVCDGPVMDAEHDYLRILERLSNYEIAADGTLILSTYGTPTIRARSNI